MANFTYTLTATGFVIARNGYAYIDQPTMPGTNAPYPDNEKEAAALAVIENLNNPSIAPEHPMSE